MARAEYFDFLDRYGKFNGVFDGDMNSKISKEGYLACFCKLKINKEDLDHDTLFKFEDG